MKNLKHSSSWLAASLALTLAIGISSASVAATAQKKAPASYANQSGLMGPGMMGGYGMMGPGMMGGYGTGAMWGLDLTDEQQSKITKIQDEVRKKNWGLMDKMMDEQAKLRDLYIEPKRDAAAINSTYKRISDLQQQMFEMSVDARNRMEAVLTKEQQEKLRNHMRRGWMSGY